MLTEYPEVLTVEETCEILRIGKNRCYELLKKEILNGYREGTAWRISKEAVIHYIRNKSMR